jgi:hypothetical protein
LRYLFHLAPIAFGLRRLDGAFPSAQPPTLKSGNSTRPKPKRCQATALQSARRLAAVVTIAILALIAHVALAGRVTLTNNLTIIETNFTYDGEDIVVSGATLTVHGPHAFNSHLLTNLTAPLLRYSLPFHAALMAPKCPSQCSSSTP